MAEYIIQDTTLTAIADSIREKTGSSDLIPVPDMASLISNIEAGGFKFNGNTVYGGVIVPSTDGNTITLLENATDVLADVNVGNVAAVPNLAMVFLMDDYGTSTYETIAVIQNHGIVSSDEQYSVYTHVYINSSGTLTVSKGTALGCYNDCRVSVNGNSIIAKSTYYFRAGKRYGWIILKY